MAAPENLIDLGQFAKNEVELITREFMRIVYIESLQDYAEEAQKETKDEQLLKNMETALQSIESVIVMLDGDEEFLKFIHSEDGEESKEDAEYDRF